MVFKFPNPPLHVISIPAYFLNRFNYFYEWQSLVGLSSINYLYIYIYIEKIVLFDLFFILTYVLFRGIGNWFPTQSITKIENGVPFLLICVTFDIIGFASQEKLSHDLWIKLIDKNDPRKYLNWQLNLKSR